MKVTEKRKQILFALFAIAMLMGACQAFGQATYTCFTENGGIDTLVFKKGKEMYFTPQGKTDTITVWIEGILSKSHNENTFCIKAKYPNSIKADSKNGLRIDLIDIGIVEFKDCSYTPKDNLCTYKLMENEVMSLSVRGYNLICFTSTAYVRPITYQTSQKAFVDFFVNYYK